MPQPESPADLVAASQRVAGVIAARAGGDRDGARTLMASFADADEIATGAMVVAEMAATLLARTSGESVQACMAALSLDLEKALH